MKTTALALPLILLTPTGSAQDQRGAPLLIPADSSLVLHVKGPALLKKIHAADPMGAVLRTDSMQQLWDEICKELEAPLRQYSENLPENSPLTPQQVIDLPKTVAAFDGSVTIAAWISPEMTVDRFDPADVCFALQIEPGSADLKPLQQALSKSLEDEAEVTKQLQVGGVESAVMTSEWLPGFEIARPFLHRGRLCVLVSGDVETQLRRTLETAPQNARLYDTLRGDSIYAHVDLHNAQQILKRLLADDDQDGTLAWIRVVETLLGASAFDRATFRTYSKNGRSVVDQILRWRSEPKGVAAAMLPPTGATSKLQSYVPHHLQSTSLVHIDVPQLLRSILAMVEAIGEASDGAREMPTIAEMQEAFRAKIELRLFEDLLDHLGTDYMVVTHMRFPDEDEEEDEVDDRALQIEDTCHVVSLRNSNAFKKSLDRTIRKLALHTGRKRNEYKGQRVYTLKNPLFAGLVIHYAVHPDCLLVGFGKGGLTCLHAVLDRAKAQALGQAPEVPDKFAELLVTEREGYYAVGHTNMLELVEYLKKSYALIEEMGDEGWETSVPARIDNDAARRVFAKLMRGMMKFAMAVDPQRASFAANFLRYENKTLSYREIW